MMTQPSSVMHNWRGNSITQLKEKTLIASLEIQAGYVNATQMCKACGKHWAHYASLDSTKTYWEALSTEVKIDISELVISIKGGNNKHSQGTWVHPNIAEHCYNWCSKGKNKQKEKAIQIKLASQLQGQVEVTHPAGRIDILTKTEIIEVKNADNWIKGVGQLVVYGQSYPTHQKRLHLLGKFTSDNLSLVKQYCTPLNIFVTAENTTGLNYLNQRW